MRRPINVNESTQEDLFGCLHWQGLKTPGGYGRYGRGYAHRRVYEDRFGPIAQGMQIDHLCDTRDCVNIDHLRVSTPRENTLRSLYTVAGKNARKTHCLRGHPFDEANTYRRPDDGGRVCRTCAAMHSKEYNQRQKDERSRRRKKPMRRPPTKPRGV